MKAEVLGEWDVKWKGIEKAEKVNARKKLVQNFLSSAIGSELQGLVRNLVMDKILTHLSMEGKLIEPS